ncbi:YfjI family protein [Saccharothrix deserti]|uniref:YfjI family protein n=1 Tax=Saccharothrix deserti TaxID=2593674 RepID=UPI001EE450B2|nr:YfjI family protein [Saccharothrix deserti]
MWSGGITSWATAKLVAQRHGTDNLVLLFADTLVEHPDLYRFNDEASAELGVPITRVADGRTPWQVFNDERMIKIRKFAPCAKYLKQIPCRQWLEANADPANTVLYVGLDWTEPERAPGVEAGWAPWPVAMPLIDPPYYPKDHWLDQARKAGIEPPVMYAQGYPHANCGGACVKGGQAQWARLLRTDPDRYADNEREEQAFRDALGKDVAVLRTRKGGTTRPLPLTVLRTQVQGTNALQPGFDQDDWGGCGCMTDIAPAPDSITEDAMTTAESDTAIAENSVRLHLVPGGEPWETPAPLTGRAAAGLPAFPLDVLPGWLADQVAGIATETQTPPDLAGCIGLAALSTAAGGRAEVAVRGLWREPVNLYVVVALPPGARKSPVFSAMTSPLLQVERELVERTTPLIATAELERKIAHARAEKAAAAATRADALQQHEAVAAATDAAMVAEAITVPVLPRLIADDITSETAASLMAEQGGRLAVLSAEGGIFATLAGRYSGTPNFEVFLKGHAGDLLRVDRQSREAEHIERPALTLGLALQPSVIRDLADNAGFRERGLLGRILFSLPVDLVGNRVIGPDQISPDVVATYSDNLRALVCALAEWTDPAVLTLTNKAADLVLELEREVEPKLRMGGAFGHIRDWASKYVGATIRLAGLLHLADNPTTGWGRPIAGDTMTRAVRLGRYFAAHALAAFDLIGENDTIEKARLILNWIERTKPSRFSRNELAKGVSRSQFKTVTQLDEPLNLLEQHGYVRREPEPERRGRGRPPSAAYLVHPQFHANGGR